MAGNLTFFFRSHSLTFIPTHHSPHSLYTPSSHSSPVYLLLPSYPPPPSYPPMPINAKAPTHQHPYLPLLSYLPLPPYSPPIGLSILATTLTLTTTLIIATATLYYLFDISFYELTSNILFRLLLIWLSYARTGGRNGRLCSLFWPWVVERPAVSI